MWSGNSGGSKNAPAPEPPAERMSTWSSGGTTARKFRSWAAAASTDSARWRFWRGVPNSCAQSNRYAGDSTAPAHVCAQPLKQGDVVGVGLRRTDGAVRFAVNGATVLTIPGGCFPPASSVVPLQGVDTAGTKLAASFVAPFRFPIAW